jgi:hypothetical protein
MDTMEVNVKVAARCRPLNAEEIARDESDGATVTAHTLQVLESEVVGLYHCYGTQSKNQEIYEDIGEPLLKDTLDGYNTALFTFGETGSGKTFTMYGDKTSRGVAPLICDNLLEKIEEKQRQGRWKAEIDGGRFELQSAISVSFVGITENGVWDLLCPGADSLQIKRHGIEAWGMAPDKLTEMVSAVIAYEHPTLTVRGGTV